MNLRVVKSIDADADGTADEVSHIIYDGLRAERDAAGDHPVLSFDGAGSVEHRYLYGPAVDQILADEQLDTSVCVRRREWGGLGLTEGLVAEEDGAAFGAGAASDALLLTIGADAVGVGLRPCVRK